MKPALVAATLAFVSLGACNPKGDEGPPNDPTPNGPVTPPPASPPQASQTGTAGDGDTAKELAELQAEIDADDAAETE